MSTVSIIPVCGGMYGAYLAGVLRELAYTMEDYDIRLGSVHAFSAGAWTMPYFVAAQKNRQQLGSMEMIWLHRACGRQLFDFTQLLKGGSVLQLQRMRSVLSKGELRLDKNALFRTDTRFEIVVTDIQTGKPLYIAPRRLWLFRDLTASAAIPVFHPPVRVYGTYGCDGGLSDPVPIKRALDFGSKKVIVVTNRLDKKWECLWSRISKGAASLLSMPTRGLLKTYLERAQEIEDQFNGDSRIFFVRNTSPLPMHLCIDTDAGRIAKTYELGKKTFCSVRQAFLDWATA